MIRHGKSRSFKDSLPNFLNWCYDGSNGINMKGGNFMSFSTKWRNEVLNYLFGGTAPTLPSSIYIGLHVGGSPPSADGTGVVEPVGNGYARVAVVRNTTNFPASTTGQIKNGTAITFPKATGSWGTATHYAIFDAATGGNVLDVGDIPTDKAIGVDDTPSIGANGLTISLTGTL